MTKLATYFDSITYIDKGKLISETIVIYTISTLDNLIVYSVKLICRKKRAVSKEGPFRPINPLAVITRHFLYRFQTLQYRVLYYWYCILVVLYFTVLQLVLLAFLIVILIPSVQGAVLLVLYSCSIVLYCTLAIVTHVYYIDSKPCSTVGCTIFIVFFQYCTLLYSSYSYSHILYRFQTLQYRVVYY